jgi:RHS repeat-associated protein
MTRELSYQYVGVKHSQGCLEPKYLGNVLQVVTDRKLPVGDTHDKVDYYTADVIMYSDYYPYGMVMPKRHGNADYRYGFQGQELDDEVKGNGNSVNYKYRMHDPRVGRFFAVDPLTSEYPHYTPYSFSGNKVINSIELEGLEEFLIIRENIDASSYTLTSIWDITARNRDEKGKVQIYNASTGTLSVIRSSTLEERKNNYFRMCIKTSITPKLEEQTNSSAVARDYGLSRGVSSDGLPLDYLQTKSCNAMGEHIETWRADKMINGITAVQYTMPEFSRATPQDKVSMTQPSLTLMSQIDALADKYAKGEVRNIRIQITTNNPSTTPDIVESNTMRQNAIVERLVSQGVDRNSITLEPPVYNNTTWDAEIKYDEVKK